MDDAVHLIRQCPKLQDMRNEMFAEFEHIPGGSEEILNTNGVNIALVLLGRRCPNTLDAAMEQFG